MGKPVGDIGKLHNQAKFVVLLYFERGTYGKTSHESVNKSYGSFMNSLCAR